LSSSELIDYYHKVISFWKDIPAIFKNKYTPHFEAYLYIHFTEKNPFDNFSRSGRSLIPLVWDEG